MLGDPDCRVFGTDPKTQYSNSISDSRAECKLNQIFFYHQNILSGLYKCSSEITYFFTIPV